MPGRKIERTKPKNEKEVEEKVHEIDKNGRETLSKERKEQVERSNNESRRIVENIERGLDQVEMEQLRDQRVSDVESDMDAFSPSRIAFELERPRGNDREILEEIAKDEKVIKEHNRDDEHHGRSKEIRNLYSQYIIASTSSITTLAGIGTFIYTLAKRDADGRKPIPGIDTDEIRRLANAWMDKPDAEFWSELANYIEKNPQISMVDEANMLKVILSMCRDTGWLWISPEEYGKAISDFVEDIKDGNTAPAYRSVMVRKYRSVGAPNTPHHLPRRMACEVIHIAIARYLRQKNVMDLSGQGSLARAE